MENGLNEARTFFNDYEAEIAALGEEHSGLISFEQHLRARGWENAHSGA